MMRLVLVAVLMLAGAAPLRAQSLFATRGLGTPVTALDARARALGGIGVGLPDFNPSMVNPAEISGAAYRGVAAAFQPVANEVEFAGETDEIGGTRFPLIRVFYPFGDRFVAALGYGAAFDQNWSAFRLGTETIGGSEVTVRDAVQSRGGVAQLQASLAYDAGAFGFGVGAGVHTGELQLRTQRTFPDSTGTGLSPFATLSARRYSGPVGSIGVRWDVTEMVRVGASYQVAGDLSADSVRGNLRSETLPMPSQLALGATAALTPRVATTVGVKRADYGQGAHDVLELGAGVEWGGFTLGSRRLPLRLGYHRADLPYRVGGAAAAESAIALGIGGRFAITEEGALARVDAALERGGRETDAVVGGLTELSESFWRFTLSISLFGR